ncbi:OmcA/MtrC family decaheme c-type cytochrome [Shewanella benthica]|uniref:OmcA/MtrC family decaheme c-type cytochrome n=1 Tax=Shewanella benthica TaxID=43661 RepID=UPI00187A27AA|nr:OmcA/MtrC family decaheme c-type cytochrome [Shewanella benthica]MBE7214351.1 OmcA/MtrC family decaheme c-type cytochrome [Shewanella benthica]MCL1064132.1 OmcA/MtrC family decaheme c-type cytochrome [Shewanella benthica]
MMKKFNFSAASKALLAAGALSIALAGCGGDDGKNGEDGKPGPVGVNIDSAKSVNATFTNATVEAGTVTVDFSLENDNGVAVLGLTKDHDLRFGIAQLTHVTELMGETGADRGYQWQAYINAEKAPNPDWIPEGESDINPTNQFQANVEKASDCETCFVDNGDGTYTYTFQQNIGSVTTPVEVVYSADYTQRATLELELPSFAANANFDWQPSTGTTEGIQTREVVSIETCYTCHQPDSLEFHGGRRINLENCVSCHTATSGDPESGNSVDFTFMIHAIHKGQDRMTSTPEGMVPAPYKVIGYGGGIHDYGKVMFPQGPAADCSSCHLEGENAPANADLFKADLSNTACIGCHTEKPSQNHSSTNCVSCHNSTDTYSGTGSAEKRHGDVLKAYKDAEAMTVKFSNIGLTDGKFSFEVQILDKDGVAIAGEFINQGTRVVVAWDSDKDYPAYTEASYSDRRIKLQDGSYDEGTKTFTIIGDNFELPTDAAGKTFELWSAVEVCFNNGGYGVAEVVMTECSDNTRSIEVKDAPYHFVWSGTGEKPEVEATMRRDIIDASKCQGCHNQEIYHYDNGVNCQTCHTSDKSIKESVRNSGKYDKATSFAYKAHEAEGHYLKYAGVGSSTVIKTDCMTCHTDDGIKLGRSPERVWTYPNMETFDKGGIYVSSDAGACLSCHQKYLSDSGKSHIETNGGILDGISAEDVQNRAKETCSTCHSPEKLMELHGN